MADYNIPALKKLRATIVAAAKAGTHDQASWGKLSRDDMDNADEIESGTYYGEPVKWLTASCPTTACAAGWTVVNSGAQLAFKEELLNLRVDGSIVTDYCVLPNKSVRNVKDYATEILGLGWSEADELFFTCKTSDEVIKLIDEILRADAHKKDLYEWRLQYSPTTTM